MEKKREEVFETLMDTVYEIGRLAKDYDLITRKYGTSDELYMLEVHTIRRIGRDPNITITEIARITGRTKGAVSILIDRLVEKGLIIKERSAEDQRQIKLILTEKGKTVYEYHDKLDQETYARYLSCLDQYKTEKFVELNNFLETLMACAKS